MEQKTAPFPTFLTAALGKRMLTGTVIGFVVISFFVFGVDNPDPGWGTYWRIKPLVLTPLAGAGAGVFYHLMAYMRNQHGWIKIAGWIFSILGYIVVLWLGTVLGLNGTMWD